ncbi:50S ribosomal protein L30 [Candidatus Poriferisodalis sp.]|uniref:50S ribosomal protein L30 n=1 Tax=Candidatus Poriferisodalis sp. TaxID=3101277 RepID=UPI003B01970E
MNASGTPQIVVTQVRSAIGAKPKARGALRALRLGKIGRSHTLPDRPEIRGMLRKVSHLITVEHVTAQEVGDAETA